MATLSEARVSFKDEVRSPRASGDFKKVKNEGPVKAIIDASWVLIQYYLGRVEIRGGTGLANYPKDWFEVLDKIDKERLDGLFERFENSENRVVIKTFAKIAQRLKHISDLLGNYYAAMDERGRKSWEGMIKRDVKEILEALEYLEKFKK
jgi:hypothetical protein